MFKLYSLLSFFFVVVISEVNIEQFYGQWIPIVSYPEVIMPIPTKCEEYVITKKNSTEQCQCGDKNNVPIVEIKSLFDNIKMSYPLLIASTSAEVESSLQMICICDGKPEYHITFRPMNENYFIQYEYAPNYLHSEKKSKSAIIFVKKIPSPSELQAIRKYDDLKDRTGSVMCLPAFFSN